MLNKKSKFSATVSTVHAHWTDGAELRPAMESCAGNWRSAMSITVTLIGPDDRRSTVTMNEDITVRDAATSKYDLFWRTLKKNGALVPFTATLMEGDIVSVEDEGVDQS